MIQKFGILGGGQLALMLIDAAIDLGLSIHCFAASSDDPAAKRHPSLCTIGTTSSALSKFLTTIDILSFENEFIDEAFARVIEESSHLKCYPSLDSITAVSNKLTQKKRLVDAGISTSTFTTLDLGLDATDQWQLLCGRFPEGFVLKWARLGYDGYGVLILKPQRFREDGGPQIAEFLEKARSKNIEVYAESYVDYTLELAIVASASSDGHFAVFPTTISTQVNGRCAEVFAPAISFGISAHIAEECALIAKKIALAFQLVGCFAVEFFLTSSGQLLVNEIAPRVHNSGHYSIDATSASQFKQHWLALAGETSATPKHLPGCSAMLNLLGPPSYQGAIDPPLIQTPCSRVHWYDKSESRPGRKLGHINILANSKEGLMKLVEKVRREIDTWHQDKLNPTLTVQRGANP